MRKPNLVIAGVTKAGTTSLYTYLRSHPDICSSDVKETCHFLPLRYAGEVMPRNDNYFAHFATCGDEKYVFEATPGYYYGGKTIAAEIKRALGDARIILLFRNPVERFFSFFDYQKNMMNLPQEFNSHDYFEKCCEPFDPTDRNNEKFWGVIGGFYSDYFQEWAGVFGSSLGVFFFDDLRSDPKKFMMDVCSWLDLDARFYDNYTFTVENRSMNYYISGLHRAALSLNVWGEKFWRANPRIKRFLRELYYSVNGTGAKKQHDPEIVSQLTTLFEPYNRILAMQLQGHGHTSLPPWLTFAKTTRRRREPIMLDTGAKVK